MEENKYALDKALQSLQSKAFGYDTAEILNRAEAIKEFIFGAQVTEDETVGDDNEEETPPPVLPVIPPQIPTVTYATPNQGGWGAFGSFDRIGELSYSSDTLPVGKADNVQQFMNDEMVPEEYAQTSLKQVYDAYTRWMNRTDTHHNPVAFMRFLNTLVALDFDVVHPVNSPAAIKGFAFRGTHV